MKKVLLSITIIIVSIIAFTYQTEEGHSNRNGAPAGRTGSPADGSNCSVSCHTSSAISNSPNGVITSTIPSTGYIPGQTYTITGTVTGTGLVRFGFEISPQAVNGTLRGTPVITDNTNTQIVSTKYITHRNAGTSGSNSKTWSFNWVAPAAGTGAFSFYGAFNAANNNNNDDSGDQIYLATLPVVEAARIGTQPTAQSVCAGATATFTVTATGTSITYLWKKNGVPLSNGGNISGATSATLTITNTSQTDADNYTVEVTGSGNTVVSNTVALTVNATTGIGTQPIGQRVCEGTPINLSVVATGTNLSYQWKRGNTNVGTNAASLAINNATTNDGGNYTCVITGTCGNVTTNTAVVTVIPSVIINTQPQSQTLCENSAMTLMVGAVGSGPLTFQWKRGTTVVGGNSPGYTNTATAGDYTCTVTDTCGNTVISNIASIIVLPALVNNGTTFPTGTHCEGDDIVFTMSATGVNVVYTWTKDNQPINNNNQPVLLLPNAVPAQNGVYKCVVSADCGASFSSSTTITILPATSITTQPVSQSACLGSSATFTTVATGNNLTYQWKKDGSAILNQTGAGLTLSNISNNDVANYTCEVRGTCDTVTTNIAALSIATSANISQQPQSQIICIGNPVTLTVVGSAGSNTTYQWFRNNQPIGTNLPSFTIAAATINSAGNYKVTINGDCGTVTSNIAILSIGTPTSVNNIFTTSQACEGEPYTLGVSADGTNLTYQWMLDNNDIANETSATYSIVSLIEANSGTYSVQVNGDCGNIPALINSLEVISLPQITMTNMPLPVCQGSAVELFVQTTGDNLNYQWYKNGVEIPNETDVFYSDPTPANNDIYICSVWNTCDTIPSDPILVTVHPLPNPQIIQTGSQQITVTNGPFISYQWLDANLNIIIGAQNSGYVAPFEPATYYVVVTDINGCVDTSDAFFYIPESIGENPSSAINIYPNPTTGNLYFTMPANTGNFNVKILNGTGQLVLDNMVAQGNSLNIGQLPAGLYVVSVSYKNNVTRMRLLKE